MKPMPCHESDCLSICPYYCSNSLLPLRSDLNILRPRPNEPHFADNTFRCILLNDNEFILLQISLKFIPKVRINNIPALIEIIKSENSFHRSNTWTSFNIKIVAYWICTESPFTSLSKRVFSFLLCFCHDDVIKWKHIPRYWPFVRGIHRSPVNSPHKGQWCGALMFSLICVWINGWVNNREAGDLRRHRAHYDVTVMIFLL